MSGERTRAEAPGVAAPAPGPSRERRPGRLVAWLLAGAVLVHVAGLAVVPLPADPLAGTFLTPDSPDWLSAGLSLAGFETTHNDRPPLLPAAYALLYRAGFERLVSLVHPAVLLLAAWAAAALARRTVRDALAAPLAALLVLLLGRLAFQARYVMGDLLAAALSALALAALVDLRTSPRAAPRFALLLLAAQATQNVLPFLLPACVLYLASERRSWPRGSLAAAAAALVASPILLSGVHLAIARAAGTPVYNLHVGHLGFLGLTGVLFYPVAGAGFLGPLLPLGVSAVARPAAFHRGGALLLAASVGAVTIFFGFFYEWLAVRFLVYLVLPLAVLAAAVLARLLRRPRPWAAWAGIALHALHGSLGHADPFWPAVPLAPGTALVAELEKLDPAHLQPWRVRRGDPAVGWVPVFLARPGELPAGVADRLFFSREEAREMSRLAAGLGPARGATGLLDPVHGATNLYVASVAFRGPVRAFRPDDAGLLYVLLRRGEPQPGGFRVRREGALFTLLERRRADGRAGVPRTGPPPRGPAATR